MNCCFLSLSYNFGDIFWLSEPLLAKKLLIEFDHLGKRQPFVFNELAQISGFFPNFRDFLICPFGAFRGTLAKKIGNIVGSKSSFLRQYNIFQETTRTFI